MQTNRPGRPAQTASAPSPAFGSKAERAARIKAAQLFLRQLRDCGGSWSDGQKVVSGAELDHLKAQVVDRLIRLRAPQAAPQKDSALIWQNMAQLQRLQDRNARRAGAPEKSTSDRLLESLRLNASGIDANSANRVNVLRRALRKLDPEALAGEPVAVGVSAREQEHLIRARSRKAFVTRAAIELWPGAVMPAGSPVTVEEDGGFSLRLPTGSVSGFALKPSQVRRRRGRGPGTEAPQVEDTNMEI